MILEIGGTIRVFSVLGGILAGVISDYSGGRATTCCAMLIIAAPMVSQTVLFFFLFFLSLLRLWAKCKHLFQQDVAD